MEKLLTQHTRGWYVGATISLTDALDIGASYSYFIPSTDHKKGTELITDKPTRNMILLGIEDRPRYNQPFQAWLKSTTGTIRYDIKDNWTAKFEVTYNDGFGVYTSAENPKGGLSRYWLLYAVKVTFHF